MRSQLGVKEHQLKQFVQQNINKIFNLFFRRGRIRFDILKVVEIIGMINLLQYLKPQNIFVESSI